jgi:hypothetical protein
MEGLGERWLLLHGTPLTPQVWDGAAGHLRRYGPVAFHRWNRPYTVRQGGKPTGSAGHTHPLLMSYRIATHLREARIDLAGYPAGYRRK